MYFAYNTKEYTTAFFDELGELVSWAVGLFTGDEVTGVAETLSRARQEMHYDNLLKSVFTTNYTASNGTTLLDVEASDTMIRQLQDITTYFKAFSESVNKYTAASSNFETRAGITNTYISKYALPYSEAAEKALDSLGTLANGTPSYEDKRSAQLAAHLATVAQLACVTPESSYMGFSYSDFLHDYFQETGVDKILKAAGKPYEFADTSLENILFLNSIQRQRDTLTAPLERISQHTENDDMGKSIANFKRLLSSEYDNSLLSWDSIQTYLRNNRVVSEALSKALAKSLKKALHLTEDYMLGATVSNLVSITGITAWISDQAIGLKDICAKTFELLYWEDLLNASLEIYRMDLSAYQENPNEDTARNVLDDLLLLQRLRLYGEKIAYALGSAPNNTWLGWMLDGEDAQLGWDMLYQRSVDILMAASPIPVLTGLSVGSGETMLIEYMNGAGFIGRSGGKYYADLPSRLAGGASINGNLIINTAGQTFTASYLDFGSTGSLMLTGGGTCCW